MSGPQAKTKDEAEEDPATLVRARRIVVSDAIPEESREIRGRRLENPPDENQRKVRPRRRPYVFGALIVSVLVVVAAIAVLATKKLNTRRAAQPPPVTEEPKSIAARPVVATGVDELRRIEEHAKQVMRRISRDNRPYSFSENSLKEIQTRVNELSRSSRLSNSLRELQTEGGPVVESAAKEGLQPSLVLLLGLALTKGGESGDCVAAAAKALPALATLNKTFGSSDGDSCLILIAAFQEGPGTRRSHPLLKRMSDVVSNPLTERNIWYLNEQKILSADAYALAIDTLAFGVITRNPREFGFETETLNF
jgi:hypothetical protein